MTYPSSPPGVTRKQTDWLDVLLSGLTPDNRRAVNANFQRLYNASEALQVDISALQVDVAALQVLTAVLPSDGVAWDDFSVPLTRDKQGQSSKPDYDFTNLGLLFPRNDATEIAYGIIQMRHEKKLSTAIHLHLHYVQTSTIPPTFKVDYRWYNNGAEVPGSFTTLSTADGNKAVFSFPGSISMLQIGVFPEIAAPESENVSSNFEFKLYRDDDVDPADVLAKYIDIHYQIDALGSDDEYVK